MTARQRPTRDGMGRYIVRRVLLGIGQVALLLMLLFVLVILLPGDAADVQATDQATTEQIIRSRKALGLDLPPEERFGKWVSGLLHADLGSSLATGQPVSGVIGGPFAVTALLAGITTLLLIPLALGAGFTAGLHPGSLRDRTITTVSIVMDSVPDFVVALLLVAWLALSWQLLPATFLGVDLAGMVADPRYFLLPVTVMLLRVGAPLVRLVRAGVVTVMDEPYVRQARRLGLPRRTVLLRHVAPNALAPAMQELGRTSDGLLSGVLIVEAVFVVPGVASTLITAINNRDEPVVLAVVLVTGSLAIAVNVVIDVIGRRMVPRSATA